MNVEAGWMGCKNTHFVTPNGLYAPGHYSCANDLALIARYAILHCPVFSEIA
jgi:D-alanyl-D-alanine carboxypeptidase